MKITIMQFSLIVWIIMAVSFMACDNSDELPPLTSESASVNYPLPKALMMSEDERNIVYEKLNEYQESSE